MLEMTIKINFLKVNAKNKYFEMPARIREGNYRLIDYETA